MGASIDRARIIAKDKQELYHKFNLLVESRAWEDGHGGYTGTFAEKGGVEVVSGVWSERDADKHAIDNNDKWGPAFAYNVGKKETGETIYYIVGWCSD